MSQQKCSPLYNSKADRGNRLASGQVIIEYLLLMLVAVAVASIFSRALVKRSADEKGALFKRWDAVGKQIGNDDPGK